MPTPAAAVETNEALIRATDGGPNRLYTVAFAGARAQVYFFKPYLKLSPFLTDFYDHRSS